MMLCALLVLATLPAAADPVDEVGPVAPSVVRLPECGTVEAEGREDCKPVMCPPGTVTCLDRQESEGVVLLRQDRDRCVDALDQCRADAVLEMEVETGWDPWTVVGVTVGIVVSVGALALAGGYLLAKAEEAGRI